MHEKYLAGHQPLALLGHRLAGVGNHLAVTGDRQDGFADTKWAK